MERSGRTPSFPALLLAGPLPERRVMIYLGFGSALGARGLSEHVPRGNGRRNLVSHFVTRCHLKLGNGEAFCQDCTCRDAFQWSILWIYLSMS